MISAMQNKSLTTENTSAYASAQEIRTSERSGNRTRQSCGFVLSGPSVYGREGADKIPGNREEAHRLRSGSNLPAASMLLATNPIRTGERK